MQRVRLSERFFSRSPSEAVAPGADSGSQGNARSGSAETVCERLPDVIRVLKPAGFPNLGGLAWAERGKRLGLAAL